MVCGCGARNVVITNEAYRSRKRIGAVSVDTAPIYLRLSLDGNQEVVFLAALYEEVVAVDELMRANQ